MLTILQLTYIRGQDNTYKSIKSTVSVTTPRNTGIELLSQLLLSGPAPSEIASRRLQRLLHLYV